jgi:TrmH family RNA methyltransferase
MGSIARVPVLYTDLAGWLAGKRPVKIYAAALSGKMVNGFPNLTEGIILVGNESRGISKQLLELADERITIPRIGMAESLNAAVATGIILSHLVVSPAPIVTGSR